MNWDNVCLHAHILFISVSNGEKEIFFFIAISNTWLLLKKKELIKYLA